MNTVRLNTIGEVVAKKTSGGAAAVPPSDVNFYDSDGTILYSYTAEDFLALTELPKLQDKQGLKADGWTMELEEAQELVKESGMLDIGAYYITDTGETRLYISITDSTLLDIELYMATKCTIDWGDGIIEDLTSVYKNIKHTYPSIGDYVIRLITSGNKDLTIGANSSYAIISGKYSYMLKKAELGENCRLGQYAFKACKNLEEITVPRGLLQFSSDACYNCYSLKQISFPKGISRIPEFSKCYSLVSICLPNGITTIDEGAFSYCYSLRSVIIPKGVAAIPKYTFQYCYSLVRLFLPNSITSTGMSSISGNENLSKVIIADGANGFYTGSFYQCHSLLSIRIPPSMTTAPTFSQCTNLLLIDMSDATSVITAGGSMSLPSTCKIVVPDALYDEWIAATNWSAQASKIIKKSDWDASQS